VTTLLHRRFWPILALCCALAALVLVLMPAEKTIGQVIKIVYLHGALSRAGMIGFWAAGAVGLVFLIRPRPALFRWTRALAISGWGCWTLHFLVSMPATRLTWGPWIAWGEPRVTMTLQVIAVGLVVLIVSWLVDHAHFTAGANLLLGIAVAALVSGTGILRHPLDPIGASPSPRLQFIYLLLVIPLIVVMLLTAWRLAQAQSELASSAFPDTAPSVIEERVSK
jgi:hypothetical protein